MKQKCHSWIALRSIGLILDDPQTRKLAKVLIPMAKHSYMGCWLPDMPNFKKGHGIIGNHTFKNAPYEGENSSRFIVSKDKLLSSLDSSLFLHRFIESDATLKETWWGRPYKAIQKEGDHLPNCISSIFDSTADLLLLGNNELARLVPGETKYAKYLHESCALSKDQVSTFFFMMSHYIADSFMPCHADKRKLAAFKKKGIHEGWESHWENRVGTYFSKKKLLETTDSSETVIQKAGELDEKLGLSFKTPLTWPDNDNDIWETAVLWNRGSFAFSSSIFPIDKYPYGGEDQPLFKEYFINKKQLAEYDRIILQSAVYAVASTWKKVWLKFKK